MYFQVCPKEGRILKKHYMNNRYHFIEMHSFWQGSVNSSQIIEYFKVSRTQAQKYLSAYQTLHPHNMQNGQLIVNTRAALVLANKKDIKQWLFGG